MGQPTIEIPRGATKNLGCPLNVHAASVTVAEHGTVTPAGGDHFAVLTPYYRRWREAKTRAALSEARSLTFPEVRGDPLPDATQLSDDTPSAKIVVRRNFEN